MGRAFTGDIALDLVIDGRINVKADTLCYNLLSVFLSLNFALMRSRERYNKM